MPIIHTQEGDLFYATSGGEGPALVLIHGAGGSHLHWPASLRRLPGARVYTIDLPGHGRSGGAGKQRIEDYVADVMTFLDSAGVEQTICVGHSMGGAISQMAALLHPDRVAGLVLMGTGAKLRVAPAILEGIRRDFKGVVHLIAEWLWGPEADPSLIEKGREWLQAVDPDVLLGDFIACDHFDVREQVGRIAVPTLVITGTEDQMTPVRFGQWLADHIPSARFLPIKGAGHMVALEKSHEVSEGLRAWMEETGLLDHSHESPG